MHKNDLEFQIRAHDLKGNIIQCLRILAEKDIVIYIKKSAKIQAYENIEYHWWLLYKLNKTELNTIFTMWLL